MHTRTCPHSRCLLVIMAFSYNNLFPRVHDMENTNHRRPGFLGAKLTFCYAFCWHCYAESVQVGWLFFIYTFKNRQTPSNPKINSRVSSCCSYGLIERDPVELGRTVRQQFEHWGELTPNHLFDLTSTSAWSHIHFSSCSPFCWISVFTDIFDIFIITRFKQRSKYCDCHVNTFF